MKVIFSIILIFLLYSCECVNNYETPKENIPEQNSNLQIVNLSYNYKSLEAFSNDIYIEKLNYKEVKNNSAKYISGNSILNLRHNDKVVLASGLKLEENNNYFSVIFDNNSSISSIYKESISENNLRIWNLNYNDVSIRIFNLNINENYSLSPREVSGVYNLPNGTYQIVYTINNQDFDFEFIISSNKVYELCFNKSEFSPIEIERR